MLWSAGVHHRTMLEKPTSMWSTSRVRQDGLRSRWIGHQELIYNDHETWHDAAGHENSQRYGDGILEEVGSLMNPTQSVIR